MRAWQFAQKVPALIDVGRFADGLELLARPVDGLQGNGVEPIWVEESGLIVVPQDSDLGMLDNFIQAFTRIGAIPDNVTQAQDVADFLTTNVGENRQQRFEIRMDIAY